MEPVVVCRETYYLDGRKPFGRVEGWVSKRRQLAHSHQNLNVMLCETQEFRRRSDIEACR